MAVSRLVMCYLACPFLHYHLLFILSCHIFLYLVFIRSLSILLYRIFYSFLITSYLMINYQSFLGLNQIYIVVFFYMNFVLMSSKLVLYKGILRIHFIITFVILQYIYKVNINIITTSHVNLQVREDLGARCQGSQLRLEDYHE